MLLEWFDKLSSRGVYVHTDRERTMKEFIVDLLYREKTYIAVKEI